MSAREAVLACPGCGRPNDRHRSVDPTEQPADGDASICWACGVIGIFVGTPVDSIRRTTPEELEEISQDPEVRAAQAAISSSLGPGEALRNLRRARP